MFVSGVKNKGFQNKKFVSVVQKQRFRERLFRDPKTLVSNVCFSGRKLKFHLASRKQWFSCVETLVSTSLKNSSFLTWKQTLVSTVFRNFCF